MPRLSGHTSLSTKIALMGASSVLITAIALVLLSVWQSGQYNALAQGEVDALIEADLNHITQGVFNLVRTENDAVQNQVNGNLNVARHLLAASGGVQLGDEKINWTAINQFTKDAREIDLPKFMVGGLWVGKNSNLEIKTPIVDEVTSLVGETALLDASTSSEGRAVSTVQTRRISRRLAFSQAPRLLSLSASPSQSLMRASVERPWRMT